ncbi:MAG: 6-hydroxymethylpterin diphosphokinase MptE-like protein [Pseudomonadota bacterium]
MNSKSTKKKQISPAKTPKQVQEQHEVDPGYGAASAIPPASASVAASSATAVHEVAELNSMQESTRLKLIATYQANLIFFQQEFPFVYEELMQSDPGTPFELEENGGLWIKHKSHAGSPAYFVELGKVQFKFFDDPATRARITTPTRYLDDAELIAPHQHNPHFYCPLEPRFRTAIVDKFKALCPNAEDHLPSPGFGERQLPIIVTFGVGYGHDIKLIIENYDLRHFIIVEPDIKNLDFSLYFVDYVALYHQFIYRGGRHFTILTSPDKAVLANDLMVTIRAHWPPYFARGIALHFNDYKSEEVKDVWNILASDMFKFYAGWGFFDDEILSLLHSAQNALRNIPVCVREKNQAVDQAIAFVVGSGPSLDKLWPLIETYRDRVVVICCGSAISAFMKKGVKPDYHIEIERTDFTYEFLSDVRVRTFLADVPLLFLPLIPPACFSFSNQPLMILKAVDGGTQLIDIENKFPRFSTGPTVTNAGTDFALRMGFKEIYLLGVDVGYPSKEGPHHSKMSFYYEEEHALDSVAKIANESHAAAKQTIKVPGNFGDEVESSFILMQCRDLISQSIRIYGGQCTVYNLNYGAEIKRAEPLHAEDINIVSSAADRQASLERIATCFSLDYPHDIEKNLGYLAEQMEAVHADVRNIFAKDISNKMDCCEVLRDLADYLFAKKHASTAVFPMLRGSLFHMCQFFYECLTLIRDEEVALAYAHAGFAIILDFLLGSRDLILQLPEEARQRLMLLQQEIGIKN